MLLIMFLGIIAKLTSVSGDCVVGTQDVNLEWDEFAGDRLWYYRKQTPGAVTGNFSCFVVKFASPEGNKSPITIWGYDNSTQSPTTVHGYATNWNNSYWEEVYPQQSSFNGHNYPMATDYNSYLIYQYCFSEANEMYTYVSYRSQNPDEETVNKAKNELKKHNIEYNQLADFPFQNCSFAGSSTEGGSSA